jgi:hypothetical protein
MAIAAWGRGTAFLLVALANAALAAALFFFGRCDPARCPKENAEKFSFAESIVYPFTYLKETNQLKILTMIMTIIMSSLLTLQGLWVVPWYQAIYGLSQPDAVTGASLISVGLLLGNLTGIVAFKSIRYRREVILVAYTALVGIWCLFMLCNFLRAGQIITFTLGMLIGYSSGLLMVHTMTGVNEIAPAGQTGSVYGLVNGIFFMGVIVCQSLTGFILDFFPGSLPGTYTPQGFLAAFAGIVAVMLASLIGGFQMKNFEAVAKV